jgi:hypothetical protein
MERIAWPEIPSRLVASGWTELEAFAGASMRGLRHKVRHKIEGPQRGGAGHNVRGELERNQYRVAFSVFCPTMMRPTSGLSG